ncbi:MAG TPA: hypothetical protein VNO43_07965 [Candidatus Eisenbacteria bacterium]|nr:hypothetical protein [Candidatus Eisenbacteria bacterium]
MKPEQPVDRVFELFDEMKRNFEERLAWFDEEIRKTRLEYLEHAVRQNKDALAEILSAIDRQLIETAACVEEYQRVLDNLTKLDEAVRAMGGATNQAYERIPGEDVAGVLVARIELLKSQGKI